ncbi:hypothetical protein [Chamaesiphon sp.]|uniref:hypothetical protein n=1 Tax=Chamaesiphon sp. TaxID=2814140 RepID=UPI0035930F4F
MLNGQRFPFVERNSSGQTATLPYLPLTLRNGNNRQKVMALLDTGASVNVLPYELGLQLGAVWENQTVQIPLSGNLAQSEARGLVISGTVGDFSPILLAFAWTNSTDVPVIFGHMNFFAEFNVCFYRHESAFELFPRNK